MRETKERRLMDARWSEEPKRLASFFLSFSNLLLFPSQAASPTTPSGSSTPPTPPTAASRPPYRPSEPGSSPSCRRSRARAPPSPRSGRASAMKRERERSEAKEARESPSTSTSASPSRSTPAPGWTARGSARAASLSGWAPESRSSTLCRKLRPYSRPTRPLPKEILNPTAKTWTLCGTASRPRR